MPDLVGSPLPGSPPFPYSRASSTALLVDTQKIPSPLPSDSFLLAQSERATAYLMGCSMQSRPLVLAAVLSLLSLARCECGDTLNRVAPKIEIADPFDATVSVCADVGIRDCTYDFGEVPIGQARFFQIAIKNPSPVDLVLTSIAFDPSSDPSFSLSGELPVGVALISGGVPQVVGHVVVGDTGTLELTVRNTGRGPLQLTNVFFVTGGGIDFAVASVPTEET